MKKMTEVEKIRRPNKVVVLFEKNFVISFVYFSFIYMRFCCGSYYLTALGKYKVSYSTDAAMPSRFPDAHEIFGGHSFSYVSFFFTHMKKIWPRKFCVS
jgi:hypothetical protein